MAKKPTQKPPPLKKLKIYCDSCFFIAIFNNETDRCGICKQIIADAQHGKVDLVTSYLTIAECVAPSEGKHHAKKPKTDRVAEFFSHEYIEKFNVDYSIADYARRLQMDIPLAIKPYDAIHLATARLEAVDMMFTYDDKLLRLDQHKGLERLKVCKPCRTWDSQLTIAGVEYKTLPDGTEVEIDMDEGDEYEEE